MDVSKILAIVFLATVLVVLLKEYRAEYAIFISVLTGVLVILTVVGRVYPAILQLEERIQLPQSSEYCIKTAVKCIGITYMSTFVADTCRDFGQNAMASRAELAAKCAVLLLSLPLLFQILDTALEWVRV